MPWTKEIRARKVKTNDGRVGIHTLDAPTATPSQHSLLVTPETVIATGYEGI
jgi:hypothetical protein